MKMRSFGEILGVNKRGEILRDACRVPSVKSIVEVGTLDGTGSTKIIIEELAIKARSSRAVQLLTIEANKAAHELAIANIGRPEIPVQIIHGSLIHVDSPLLLVGLNQQESFWFQNDANTRFANVPNILEYLPAQFDLLVLDGGEFTTFNDYLVLRNRCTYLFLDDINVRKNRLVFKTALDDGFSLLKVTDEANGACLLGRVAA
jgi:hypothetical protein